jgi:hypothetical protein
VPAASSEARDQAALADELRARAREVLGPARLVYALRLVAAGGTYVDPDLAPLLAKDTDLCPSSTPGPACRRLR